MEASTGMFFDLYFEHITRPLIDCGFRQHLYLDYLKEANGTNANVVIPCTFLCLV
jgi:hypothetical protein